MKTTVCIVLVLLAAGWSSMARIKKPERVPVERVLKNAATWLKAHPDDAQGWYMLGRIHYVAFVNDSAWICVYRPGNETEPPSVARDDDQQSRFSGERKKEATRRTLKKYGFAGEESVPSKGKIRTRFDADVSKEWERLEKENWKPAPEFSPAQAADHAVQAIAAFDRSIALEPKKALTHLTRASLLRKIRDWRRVTALEEVPAPLQAITAASVRETFFSAWELSVSADIEKEKRPAFQRFFIAEEAGDAYLEQCALAGPDLTAAERETAEKVRASMKQLAAKPLSGIISPVIFSMEENSPSSIHGLLAPGTRVSFDLRGCGCGWL